MVLAVMAGAGGPGPAAQAQVPNGSVTGLTLSSDAPGDIVVSWDTPAPAPTDYRLMWAPVGEDYLSWKNANETDRGNSHPSGDATSLTLSGLSQGDTFKVRLRARYHSGEHADSPWSGPWTAEVTQRVRARPLLQRRQGCRQRWPARTTTPSST